MRWGSDALYHNGDERTKKHSMRPRSRTRGKEEERERAKSNRLRVDRLQMFRRFLLVFLFTLFYLRLLFIIIANNNLICSIDNVSQELSVIILSTFCWY